jgi:hypothetical protein
MKCNEDTAGSYDIDSFWSEMYEDQNVTDKVFRYAPAPGTGEMLQKAPL